MDAIRVVVDIANEANDGKSWKKGSKDPRIINDHMEKSPNL